MSVGVLEEAYRRERDLKVRGRVLMVMGALDGKTTRKVAAGLHCPSPTLSIGNGGLRRKTSVRYSLTHVTRLLRSWGLYKQWLKRKHINAASDEEVKRFKKGVKRRYKRLKRRVPSSSARTSPCSSTVPSSATSGRSGVAGLSSLPPARIGGLAYMESFHWKVTSSSDNIQK